MRHAFGSPSHGISPMWMIWPALAALVVLFFSGHRQHVLDYLPFPVLLACPLMHLMMHGRHGPDHGPPRG